MNLIHDWQKLIYAAPKKSYWQRSKSDTFTINIDEFNPRLTEAYLTIKALLTIKINESNPQLTKALLTVKRD